MLFSDVEQSTLLLTRLGRAYGQALDSCRVAQRDAWAACDGVEMGTEGDSFFVVFSTSEDAVRAAVEAQRALSVCDWPNGERVRVRMGIHTGSPVIHGDGYVGIDVHRAARIAAAAHGGQVVISDVTAKLVSGTLPAGVALLDLGGHRLKDLGAPEHLHQVLIPGVLADFPPLRSVGTISSLPVTTTPLVGRRSEVGELAALLGDLEVRLVTLTGPGGSGKTRLAIAAARAVVGGFPDGVYFVPLAAVTTADVIWSSIGEVLDLAAEDRTPPGFFAHVAGLHALLVLDNLEQMRGADAAVAKLLRVAPDAKVLATSRRPLHLTSEHQYSVPPLALPTADTLVAADASPAVQLFVDRARTVRASFALTADNSSEMAAICRHLDGLPLAIELAAARCKLLGPQALLTRLDQALDLRGADADRPPRQQALRDTIDWSYRLLPADQQALFRRLGVFAGGADLEALAAVCANGVVRGEELDLVADLVDASLINVAEDPGGEPRFAMLETIRAFAVDALTHAGELEDARRVHAAHFVDVAEQWDIRHVSTNREKAIRGIGSFDLERKNLREALTWATSPDDRPELSTGRRGQLGLALLARAYSIWNWSEPAESRHWLEAALETANLEETADLGNSLLGYAENLLLQGDPAQASRVAGHSVAVLRTLDDPHLSTALLILGWAETELGDPHAGRRRYEEALELARQSDDHFVLGDADTQLAWLAADEENWEGALQLHQTAREHYKCIGVGPAAAAAEHNVACALRKLGRRNEAHELMSNQMHQWAPTYTALNLLCGAEDYSAVLAEAGFPRFAPLLIGACDVARERMGTPRDHAQERETTDARTAAQSVLTPTEWADSYARGRTMTVQDALAEAISSTADLHA